MRRIESIHELRQIQLGILDEMHRFCEKHGLRYFLSSGSLIGAVRHKGYIPWDDDIDVSMPRKDYEVFLSVYKDETSNYRVLCPQNNRHYYYTFAKMVDRRTRMIEAETDGYEIGVYIDVFPIDYVPDDLKERMKVFRQKRLLYKIRRCKISNNNPLNSRIAYYVYKYFPLSVSQLDHLIKSLIVSKKTTNTVCNMSEAGPDVGGCYPLECIFSSVDIEFEGKNYKTMVGYKDYLKKSYGDYMTLPPVNQRLTHKFEAFWIG